MIRVGLVGPESTGKSSVGKTLEERYGYIYIPEYARTYVENLNRSYTYNDVLRIAEQQLQEENTAYNGIVLYDTELIVTKVWMLHVFGKVDPRIEYELRRHPMDLYLLFKPDIVAVPDPVRENLDKRQFFFNWYLQEICSTKRPYAIVSGQGEQRIACACNAIKVLQSENE